MKKYVQENDSCFKVLKYKVAILNKHLYSCGVVVVDSNSKLITRLCCVVSYNPEVYEIDLEQEVKKLETVIYKYKFDEGSNSSIAKDICLKIYNNDEQFLESIINENKNDLVKDLLIKLFKQDENTKIKVEYLIEKVKSDFVSTETKQYDTIDSYFDRFNFTKFFIKTKPVVDTKKGISVEKIKLKKEILCELVDKREVVGYIFRILFSENQKQFYAKVVEINKRNRYYEIICTLTPMIFTKLVLDKNQKVVVKK